MKQTLVINGGGHTVSGGGVTRIFFANTGDITIENNTLADGVAKGGTAATPPGGRAVAEWVPVARYSSTAILTGTERHACQRAHRKWLCGWRR